jgi:hypothetical protein
MLRADWCPCGDGGVTPSTAVSTLPALSGATCYTSSEGNARTPSSKPTVACTLLSLLTVAASTATSTPSGGGGGGGSGATPSGATAAAAGASLALAAAAAVLLA